MKKISFLLMVFLCITIFYSQADMPDNCYGMYGYIKQIQLFINGNHYILLDINKITPYNEGQGVDILSKTKNYAYLLLPVPQDPYIENNYKDILDSLKYAFENDLMIYVILGDRYPSTGCNDITCVVLFK